MLLCRLQYPFLFSTTVSFMCREALKGYLGGYERLIDKHNADNISVTEARQILRRLAAVRIVDPACGSGAYLLGMLHELHALNRLLDTRAEQETARDDYQRKLAIIQNNFYGVDKDEFAVNIARLRLWLSLAVEFEGDVPEPLPNLDLKIESNDSLTAASPENVGQLGIRDELIRQYRESKAVYMNTNEGDRKKALKQQINNLKAEIATWTRSNNAVRGFDWTVEFAEVFADGGFDIVVANPPYGASVDDNVRNLYFDRQTEGAQSKDTYGLFMARGLQLLRSSGQLCYIVSDTWRTIKSHKPLRKRLLENTAIAHIIDLPTWIFNATVNTCIFTATKTTPSKEHNLITADLRSIKSGDWQSLTKNLNQRFGRIDRIGSDKDTIYGFNFLPELGIERNLGLQQKLRNRIQEIHDTIGEDAAILDRTEQLNEEAMFAIYEQKGKQLSLFDPDEEEEFLDLNEAEEILRQLQNSDWGEFERIANLPNGIRTGKPSVQKATYIFCEASDPNRPHIKGYQQLFLLDDQGDVISRDIHRILGAIKSDSTIPAATLPKNHNSAVMRVKRQFAEEIKHRQAEREYNQRLTQGQRYILRELRIFFKAIVDEEVKAQVNILEKAFRGSMTQAINRELNAIRRNGVTGQNLFSQLVQIYNQHNMREWLNNTGLSASSHPISIIICSEALV